MLLVRTWSDLSPAQSGYLVQVRGPADLLPNIIRDLAINTNINTAAVLYDHTFSKILTNYLLFTNDIFISLVLEKHYNKLFVNLPIRHVYRKLGQDEISTGALLDDLVKNMKINHFFILARYILITILHIVPHHLILLTVSPLQSS